MQEQEAQFDLRIKVQQCFGESSKEFLGRLKT
jgi:hypothetical protein